MIPNNNNNNSCPYSLNRTSLDTTKTTDSVTPTPHTFISSSNTIHSDQTIPIITSRIIQPNETPPTQAQIDIVRYTWERVSEIRLPTDDPNVSSSHAFGLAFYDALFELDPSLKVLFTNIFQQARALAGMVSYIARAPNVTGTKPYRPTSCGFSSPNDKIPTIREINARKRKENTSLSFSELVTNTAANADSVTQPLDELEDTERLLYKLRELGARHYFYNVQPHQLALVGPAVLAAIKIRLGKEFLPEVAEAWTKAHAFAAYHMRIGLEAQSNWESGRRKSTTKLSSHGTKSNCNIQ